MIGLGRSWAFGRGSSTNGSVRHGQLTLPRPGLAVLYRRIRRSPGRHRDPWAWIESLWCARFVRLRQSLITLPNIFHQQSLSSQYCSILKSIAVSVVFYVDGNFPIWTVINSKTRISRQPPLLCHGPPVVFLTSLSFFLSLLDEARAAMVNGPQPFWSLSLLPRSSSSVRHALFSVQVVSRQVCWIPVSSKSRAACLEETLSSLLTLPCSILPDWQWIESV